MSRAIFLFLTLALAACSSDADNTSSNIGSDSGIIVDTGTTLDVGQDATTMPDGGRPDMTTPADMGTTPSARCAELPVQGPTIDVSPGDNLRMIAANAAPGTTLLLADGTYMLNGGDASSRVQLSVDGLTLRGASGDASAVILDGGYATNEVVTIHANNVTVAHLTVTHAVDHLIHATPRGATIKGTRIYDVRLIDGGEQFIKINADGGEANWVDDGEVACSKFMMTDAGRPNVERATGGCYTGGIDGHQARGWKIHDNHFEGIYCAGEGLAEHAVHFWSASRDTLVERNTIINCARGIGFGLVENGRTRDYADAPYPDVVGYIGHYDGIIRNNFIYADIDFYDTGIELAQAHGVRVFHNTVVSSPDASGFFSSIDYRFANTKAEIRNNITRRITKRNGAAGELSSNIERAELSLFVDAPSGDLHLAAGATDAIDQGEAVNEAGLDIDGEPHANGVPDIGADERQ